MKAFEYRDHNVTFHEFRTDGVPTRAIWHSTLEDRLAGVGQTYTFVKCPVSIATPLGWERNDKRDRPPTYAWQDVEHAYKLHVANIMESP